jgi:hypothetical protein
MLLIESSIAQIKLGNTATHLEKSALLELDGNKQGFLLPRLTDTSLINTLNPPDGMLIYFMPATSGKGLYIRKTGFWQRMTTDSILSANLNSWGLNGNNGLTGTEKLGSISNTDFSLITNNTSRITITSAGVTSILGNAVLGGTLSFSSLLAANTADTSYLTINNTTNVITKRNLTSLPFLQNLNGLTAATQTFAITTNAAAIAFSTSGGTIHNLNIPDADASNRGVVNTSTQTFAGNKTFSNNVIVNGTTKIGSSGTTLNSIIKATVNKTSFTVPGSTVTVPFNGAISQSFPASTTVSFTVSGATVGSSVTINPASALPDNCAIAYARVSAVNTIEVKFCNTNSITINGSSVIGITTLSAPASAPTITVPTMDFYFTIIQ